jgi:hypothetical protein
VAAAARRAPVRSAFLAWRYFVGASLGPLAAELPLGFAGLLFSLAALLIGGAALIAISGRPTAEVATI